VPSDRRLIFSEIAQLYDEHRPTYPDPLIDDLVELAGLEPGDTALEVGAGTGKATVMFAERGIDVVAVEPSNEMAAVARRNCAIYEGVKVEQSDFEDWQRAGRTFQLLFSAQAWHWVNATVGYARAHEALRPSCLLAAFWNRPVWSRSGMRDALLSAYAQAAPEHAPDGPMHPASEFPDGEHDGLDHWRETIARADGFGHAEIRDYEWSVEYSAQAYVGLLATTSEIRLLDGDRRTTLLAAIARAIEARGNALRLPMLTRLCLARRSV
jgi:SAM-dependent methyltransferase